MASSDSREVKAHYESLDDARDFAFPLTSKPPAEPTVEQKTAYLSELRTNTKKLQEDINTFLTEKMAQDKAREAQAATTQSKAQVKTKEEIEEENYGEEAAEDED